MPAAAPRDALAPVVALNPLNVLSTFDLDFKFGRLSFTGYLQYDAAAYLQKAPGPLDQDFRRGPIGETSDARDLRDGGYLRRFRLGAEGTLGDSLSYRAMFDLAGDTRPGDPRVYEVWLKYTRAPYALIVGAFPQLANMDGATSADSTLFLERATAANLARNLVAGEGRIGVTLRRSTPKLMVAVSLTGPVIDHAPDYSPRSAVVGRVSYALGRVEGFSVHLGANAGYVLVPPSKSALAPNGVPFQLKDIPEVSVDPTQLIDTGVISAEHASVLGLEFAAQRDNLFLQAEAFRFSATRTGSASGPDPRFFGYYVQASWVLTGERRRFDPSRAAFWFPKPDRPLGKGGWGAWEVAVRYSRMDLNAHPGDAGAPPPPGGVRGGDQRVVSAALEWYPRPRTRLMLEALHVSVDRLNPASAADPDPFGPPPDTPPPGVQIGQTFNVLAMRLRYAF